MVGTGRFELPTPRTPSECSTRLSHVPTQWSRLGRAGFRGLNQFTPAPHVAPLVHHPEAYVQAGHRCNSWGWQQSAKLRPACVRVLPTGFERCGAFAAKLPIDALIGLSLRLLTLATELRFPRKPYA